MDPFSVSTSVAGLISLGITISDGLLTYCSNYRSRDEDLAILSQRAKELKSLLGFLEQRQKESTATKDDVKSSILDCRNTCTLCLQRIDAFNERFLLQSKDSSFKGHGKAIARRVQYHFQRDKLTSFRRQVQELHVALSSQIGLLNCDQVTNLGLTTLAEFKNLSVALSNQETSLSSQLSNIVPTLNQTLGGKYDRMEANLERRLESLEQLMIASLQTPRHQVHEVDQSHNDQHTDLDREPTMQPLEALSRFPKATSTTSAASCSRMQIATVSSSKSLSIEPLLDFECHCPPTTPEFHQATCIYSFKSRKRKTITRQIKLFNFIFSCKIEAQYSPFAFPRDFQVYPNFTVRAVNPNSPAWDIVERVKIYGTADVLRQSCQDALILLRQCFSEGKGWPTDVNEGGRNLLHFSCSHASHIKDEEHAIIYLQFLKALTQMGVPINGLQRNGLTPLFFMHFGLLPEDLVEFNNTTAIFAKGLRELGAELTMSRRFPFSSFGGISFLPHARRTALEIPIPTEYGELSRAILAESETDVRKLISRSKEYLLERAHSQETPLQLAVCWPKGLELILDAMRQEAMHHLLEVDGLDALKCAIKLNQAEAVSVLLDAEENLDIEHPEVISLLAKNEPGDEILQIVSHKLAERRKALYSLALSSLPLGTFSRYAAAEHQPLFQEEAFHVAVELQQHGTSVPSWLHHIRPGSIYHQLYMTAGLANALYEAGFDHTNVSFHGFTPMMTVERAYLNLTQLLDLVGWFVSHGTDTDTPIPLSADGHRSSLNTESDEFRIIHKCAFWIGCRYSVEAEAPFWKRGRAARFDPNSETERIARLIKVEESPKRDPCTCFCAPLGCSPGSLFTRGLFYCPWEPEDSPEGIDKLLNRQNQVLDGLICKLHSRIPERQTARQFAADVLRTITFEILGMKHTCCVYDMPLWCGNVGQQILDGDFSSIILTDPCEAEELQEEDRHPAALLDELMDEFETKSGHLGQSLEDFLCGYYRGRMTEVVTEQKKLSEEEQEGMRRAGVILQVESD